MITVLQKSQKRSMQRVFGHQLLRVVHGSSAASRMTVSRRTAGTASAAAGTGSGASDPLNWRAWSAGTKGALGVAFVLAALAEGTAWKTYFSRRRRRDGSEGWIERQIFTNHGQ